MKGISSLVLLSIFTASTSLAAPPSRELLLFQDIPTVFTVSKKEQVITESPSAVSIITEEDIRAYGATNIPDILRNVAGVDVMAISATDFNVNVRGFNKDASHKLLVLIDGRSVYLDFMGIVLWESLPVVMEEIKRIEVVKGPGSAIWGGNAYSGIVNIVTKKPVEMKGTTVSASYGERNTLIGSIVNAGQKGDLSYKLSAGWKQEDNWDESRWGQGTTPVRTESDEAMQEKKGSFVIEKTLGSDSSVAFSGGIDDSYGEVLTALDVYRRDNKSTYLKLDYRRDWLRFHTYWNGLDTGIKEKISNGNFPIKTDTYDIEFEGVFNTHPNNSLVAGLNYRLNTVSSDLLSGYNQQEIWGVYLQDDFKPLSSLLITAGARSDYHPLVGWNTSPRAAVVYTPVYGHTFHISYTTAYSLPTFVQSYLHREIPVAPGINVVSHGNKDVGPEKIRSWEAGYKGQITERVKGSLDVFHNELEDFITFLQTPGNPLQFSYYNQGRYKAQGGEVSLDFFIAKNLTAGTNYSYQYIWNDAANTRVSYSPLSKANAEIRYSPRTGTNAAMWVNYVGETNWTSNAPSEDWLTSQTTRAGTDPRVEEYLLFNMKAGYRFTEETELSLSAFNLLDKRHREFLAGDEIGRKITMNFVARF